MCCYEQLSVADVVFVSLTQLSVKMCLLNVRILTLFVLKFATSSVKYIF